MTKSIPQYLGAVKGYSPYLLSTKCQMGENQILLSPSLFTHNAWKNNTSSPYDMTPVVNHYALGCPLLSRQMSQDRKCLSIQRPASPVARSERKMLKLEPSD